MHEQLWQKLVALNGQDTAVRALCRYDNGSGCYIIRLLNKEYRVDPASRDVFLTSCSDREPAGFLEQLCILAYLTQAKDSPPSGKLAKGESLPGGMFFFRGGHSLPTQSLADKLGPCPAMLHEASRHLSAVKRDFGDASVEVPVLPRIAITLIVWAGDDEFDASASILFDEKVHEHMLLDALLAATNLTVNSILERVPATN